MLSKNQTEVLKSPVPDTSTDMLLGQDGDPKSLDQAPSALAGNGGVNDPPDGRG